MVDRPRELGNFNRLGQFKAKFRLKAYISCQYLWTVRWGNGYTTTLLLEVFTHKKLCSRLYSTEIKFYSKKQKIAF